MASLAPAVPGVRTVEGVHRSTTFHWVGNGFHVSTYFPSQHLPPERVSPFVLMNYGPPKQFTPLAHGKRGVGWHPHRGTALALSALGLLLLLRFAFLWVGVYLGLRFYPNPEAVTAVRTLEFPIGFLGNPFVAVSTMPAWLGAIAVWNPLSSTVSAARQLFGDPIGAPSSWITGHALLMAIAWPLLLIAVFFPLSLHRYRRLSR